jgi:hypothetical protein
MSAGVGWASGAPVSESRSASKNVVTAATKAGTAGAGVAGRGAGPARPVLRSESLGVLGRAAASRTDAAATRGGPSPACVAVVVDDDCEWPTEFAESLARFGAPPVPVESA